MPEAEEEAFCLAVAISLSKGLQTNEDDKGRKLSKNVVGRLESIRLRANSQPLLECNGSEVAGLESGCFFLSGL